MSQESTAPADGRGSLGVGPFDVGRLPRSVPTVEGALERLAGADADVVLAIGGGSAIDTAKAIAGLLRSGTRLMDHLEGVGRGIPYPGPAVPLVAVPTTAGTGSEATRNAVISQRGTGGFKKSFRDERLVPVEAVIDPDLLASAPPQLIAANGLDALTQLLEAFVSVKASPFTDALARSGLAAVRDGLLAWHADPGGPAAPAARARMAYAALLSGICLANAGLGAVHGLASPLGALLPIPHGMACGAVLWQTNEANVAALSEQGRDSPGWQRHAEVGRLLAGLPADTPEEDACRALVSTLRSWTSELAIPGLARYGMRGADIPIVRDGARGNLRTNPVALSDAELDAILEASL